METILIGIIVALIVADSAGLTKVLHRPFIASLLIGAVLGNAEEAARIGVELELMYIIFGDDFMSAKTMVLTSVAANVMALSGAVDITASAGAAAVFVTLEFALASLLSIINTAFLPGARKAAETADGKKLALCNFLPLIIKAAVYAGVAMMIVAQKDALVSSVSALVTDHAWIFNGLIAAAYAVPCVGIAVLLRNLSAKDLPGAFFLGAAVAGILVLMQEKSVTMVIVAMVAFALGAYDYHANKSEAKPKKAAEKKSEGGAEQWW